MYFTFSLQYHPPSLSSISHSLSFSVFPFFSMYSFCIYPFLHSSISIFSLTFFFSYSTAFLIILLSLFIFFQHHLLSLHSLFFLLSISTFFMSSSCKCKYPFLPLCLFSFTFFFPFYRQSFSFLLCFYFTCSIKIVNYPFTSSDSFLYLPSSKSSLFHSFQLGEWC